MKDKIKQFFSAFFSYPGIGLYMGFGKYAGFKPNFDRHGAVINLARLRIIISYYDFMASAAYVMAENNELRNENAMMLKMFSGRTERKRRR